MGRYVCAYPIVYAIWVITRQNLVLIGSGNSPDAGNKPSDLPAQTDRLSGEVVGQADEVAHGLPSAGGARPGFDQYSRKHVRFRRWLPGRCGRFHG